MSGPTKTIWYVTADIGVTKEMPVGVFPDLQTAKNWLLTRAKSENNVMIRSKEMKEKDADFLLQIWERDLKQKVD